MDRQIWKAFLRKKYRSNWMYVCMYVCVYIYIYYIYIYIYIYISRGESIKWNGNGDGQWGLKEAFGGRWKKKRGITEGKCYYWLLI